MYNIAKALEKLRPAERKKIKDILLKLKNNNLSHLDIKKLKGREDIYRLRQGRIRIIYRIDNKDNIFVLTIERRSDNTYNF